MKHFRIPAAIALFLLPILARTLWFYQGVFWRVAPVSTPEYDSYVVPQPPFSTPAAEETGPPSQGAIILLDEAHNNQFLPSEIDSLTTILHARNARLESVASDGYESRNLADQLKYVIAYISICPNESFSLEEVRLLEGFVQRGGRILVLTDPTRGSVSYDYSGYATTLATDVNAANSLLASFDITIVNDYLYNMTQYEGNFRNVIFQKFSADAFTNGLGKVVFYAAHSIQTRSGELLLTGADTTLSSRTDSGGGLSAGALNAGGQVLAIGDMTFLQPPYNLVADNPVLIRHLADFLLEAERVHDLQDFPFLFQRPVAIVPMEDVDLTADLLGPINALQTDLTGVGVTSTMAPAGTSEKDLILLGTYTSKGIDKYLRSFGITLPSSSGSSTGSGSKIEIPEFGSIKSSGIGLILFSRDASRTSLILLAEDSDSLTNLLDVIGPSGFSSCILQGNIAVCKVGSSSDGYGNSWWDSSINGSGEAASPSVTPTPAG
jgi:hypothetical protein